MKHVVDVADRTVAAWTELAELQYPYTAGSYTQDHSEKANVTG
jgi:hypothetical protein